MLGLRRCCCCCCCCCYLPLQTTRTVARQTSRPSMNSTKVDRSTFTRICFHLIWVSPKHKHAKALLGPKSANPTCSGRESAARQGPPKGHCPFTAALHGTPSTCVSRNAKRVSQSESYVLHSVQRTSKEVRGASLKLQGLTHFPRSEFGNSTARPRQGACAFGDGCGAEGLTAERCAPESSKQSYFSRIRRAIFASVRLFDPLIFRQPSFVASSLRSKQQMLNLI